MNEQYIPASFGQSAFNCPHCRAYAKQNWYGCTQTPVTISNPEPIVKPLGTRTSNDISDIIKHFQQKQVTYGLSSLVRVEKLIISVCEHCKQYVIWYDQKMIFPDCTNIQPANPATPEDIKATYNEAASKSNKSPRPAIAILRLALQELLKQLGGQSGNINDDIATLYRNGILNEQVKTCCDIIRISGNNAVHPGVICLNEDVSLAMGAFELFNIIVEECIAVPARRKELFDKLPTGAKTAIEKRDSK